MLLDNFGTFYSINFRNININKNDRVLILLIKVVKEFFNSFFNGAFPHNFEISFLKHSLNSYDIKNIIINNQKHGFW
jgi:hypothetical protein